MQEHSGEPWCRQPHPSRGCRADDGDGDQGDPDDTADLGQPAGGARARYPASQAGIRAELQDVRRDHEYRDELEQPARVPGLKPPAHQDGQRESEDRPQCHAQGVDHRPARDEGGLRRDGSSAAGDRHGGTLTGTGALRAHPAPSPGSVTPGRAGGGLRHGGRASKNGRPSRSPP